MPSTEPPADPAVEDAAEAAAVAPGADVTRLGSYSLCVDDTGRLLLARLSEVEIDYGAWTLPGGGVDFGEHPDDACHRELEEETGLTGEIEGVAGIFSHVYSPSSYARGADLHFLGIVYRVRVTGGALRHEIGGTTDTAAWFTRDEVRGLRLVELAKFGAGLAFPGIAL